MLLAIEPALSPLQGGRTPVTVRTNQFIHKLDTCDNNKELCTGEEEERERRKKVRKKPSRSSKKR